MATAPNITPIQRPPMDEPTPRGLPVELETKLKAPLPPEAITTNDKHAHLSSIKPAYVIERMNEVFGIGGYVEKYREISMTQKTVVYKKDTPQERKATVFVATVHGTLDIPKYGIHLENFGGSENENAGDELKGACTDAFTKMCSHLGVGLDVYKGSHDRPKESEFPPCPKCGKELRKSKDSDELYCWTKKNGCGWRGTVEGMKAAESSKNGQSKPPQSTQQQPRPAAKPASDPATAGPSPDKITVEGVVSNIRITPTRDLLRLKLNDRECATRMPDLIKRLENTNGRTVTLLVAPLTGRDGIIHQIHKVIGWKAGVQ